MSTRPFILVCNDDGVYAPGIKHLWKALSETADLAVIAPAFEQSATALSITVRRPLHVETIYWPKEEIEVRSVNGTPADCIKLALNVLLPRYPDFIVSGINRGSNIGRNVLYSGTVAAVIEGVMHGVPGVAFSASDYSDPAYFECEEFIVQVMHYLIKHPLASGTFLNVNFPYKAQGKIRGVRLAEQGKEYWIESPEQRSHPFEGSPYYWLGGKTATFKEKKTSDVECLKAGYAAATPIQINDLTDHAMIAKEKEQFDTYFQKGAEIKDFSYST